MPVYNPDPALAVREPFHLVQYTDGVSADMLAEIQDELGDLTAGAGPEFLRIKVPAGGGLAYEIQTETDGVEYEKEVRCVIIFTHAVNSRWPAGDTGDGDTGTRAPICTSLDGRTGIDSATGEARLCSSCPFNGFGSGTDKYGNRTRGKACKNMRRLYVMRSGDPALYMLTVPPTSLRNTDRQLTKILSSGIPYTATEVILSLERIQSASGNDYSRVVLRRGDALPAEISAKAIQIRQRVKDQYSGATVSIEDYQPAAPEALPAPAVPEPVPVPQAPAPQSVPQAAAPVFEAVEAIDPEDELPF